MSSNTLLISVQQIKDRTGLHSNVQDSEVLPDIKYCQDAYIMPLLGTALMNKLQTDLSSGLPTGNYLVLWRDYVLDALCYYVLSESPMTLTYQLYNKGLVRKSNETTTQPDTQEILNIVNKYKSRAEWYGQRIADYLLANSELFPEYQNPGSDVDTFIPDVNAYKTSFYLDDDCKCTDGSFYPVAASKYKKGCK